MDAGTRARHQQDEQERALDPSRLRSSARLGFTGSTGSTRSTSAATAGRKRKTRRRRQRQRQLKHRQPPSHPSLDTENDNDNGSGNGNGDGNDEHASRVIPEAAAAVPAPEPASPPPPPPPPSASDADADADGDDCPLAAVTGTTSETALTEGRKGGSGSRAAASSFERTTLLNRRTAKRPSRRCNAAARRNAMTMDLQRLITEVHARPAIWDQKNVNYHNRDVILKMWREIARACEVSTDVAKSKWKHLRDNFRNELKKTYRGKGEGSSEHDSKWVWFKSLFFLRDQMNSRVIGCTLSQNCSAALRSSPEETQIEPQIDILEGQLHYEGEAHYEDLDGDSCQSLLSNDDGLHHVMPPPKLNRIGRKRSLMEAIMNDYPETDRKRYDSLHKRLAFASEEEDDTYHFLMSVRNPLRSLPLDRQMFVRLKIQELVYNEINAQNLSYHTEDIAQDVKPVRSVNLSSSLTTTAESGTDHPVIPSMTTGAEGTTTTSGKLGRNALRTAVTAELPSDASNPASLLQNCTSEGSSDGVSFD